MCIDFHFRDDTQKSKKFVSYQAEDYPLYRTSDIKIEFNMGLISYRDPWGLEDPFKTRIGCI